MNFAQVEQGNGNKVQMFGILTEIGGLQYTPKQAAKAVCKIRDDAGVEHKVHIYQGTGQLPTPQQFNQRCQFTLSTFQGNYQGKLYTGYSGFWNASAQTGQQPTPQGQNVPPQAPQTPQEVVSEDVKPNTVFMAMIIAAASSQDVPLDQVITIAKRWVEEVYAYEKPNAPPIGTDTKDDIPW